MVWKVYLEVLKRYRGDMDRLHRYRQYKESRQFHLSFYQHFCNHPSSYLDRWSTMYRFLYHVHYHNCRLGDFHIKHFQHFLKLQKYLLTSNHLGSYRILHNYSNQDLWQLDYFRLYCKKPLYLSLIHI